MTVNVIAPLRHGFFMTVNPLAKFGACVLITAVLVISVDPISASVALLLECVALALCGVRFAAVLPRIAPILMAAPLTALVTLLYGRSSGTVYVRWWAVEISAGSAQLALSTLLRVIAIGVPAVILFMTIDLTEFADALGQIMRLPSRFVIGALAGLRLLELFVDDWHALTAARRARGVAQSRAIRRFFGQAFTLFVLSLRRSAKLATAMEARGFGAEPTRTWARASLFRGRDWLTLAVAASIATLSVIVAVTTGAWNVLGS